MPKKLNPKTLFLFETGLIGYVHQVSYGEVFNNSQRSLYPGDYKPASTAAESIFTLSSSKW